MFSQLHIGIALAVDFLR